MHKAQDEHPFTINVSWKLRERSLDMKNPYSKVGNRKALSEGLSNVNVENSSSLDFEILSSTEKTNAATIYGVARINNSCTAKSEKIGNFFKQKSIIKDVIIESFEYDPDYTMSYGFGVDIVVGSSREVYISEEMQKYLPAIWEMVNWDELKNRNDHITDDVIARLTNQIKNLNDDDEDQNDENTKQVKRNSNEIEMANHLFVDGVVDQTSTTCGYED